MHLGSGENFFTLDFPFGFNSQEKYGTTSSATSKSETAKQGGGKRKRHRKEGYGSCCSCVPSIPLPTLWQVASIQCNSATGLSPGAGTAAEIFRFLAIHPSHLTLLPAVPQHICITNFPLEVVLF